MERVWIHSVVTQMQGAHVCIYMCVHVYMYAHVFIYLYMFVYMHICMHICLYMCVWVYICVYVYECLCICLCECMNMFVCVCMLVYVCIYLCMHVCVIYSFLVPISVSISTSFPCVLQYVSMLQIILYMVYIIEKLAILYLSSSQPYNFALWGDTSCCFKKSIFSYNENKWWKGEKR